jgi:hypothetical protein
MERNDQENAKRGSVEGRQSPMAEVGECLALAPRIGTHQHPKTMNNPDTPPKPETNEDQTAEAVDPTTPSFGFVVMSIPRFFNWHETDGRGSLDAERLSTAKMDYLWTDLPPESRWRWQPFTDLDEARQCFEKKKLAHDEAMKSDTCPDLCALWTLENGKPTLLLDSTSDAMSIKL